MEASTSSAGPPAVPGAERVRLGGARCDLVEHRPFIDLVARKLGGPPGDPLLVASANLDHVHHFGAYREGCAVDFERPDRPGTWVVLLDGAPLVRAAARRTGRQWPRMAGADLLPEFLAVAGAVGAPVGVLGGTEATHARFLQVVATREPALTVAGQWNPSRSDLDEPSVNGRLAAEIREAGVGLLVVALGKPRQERWLDAWAEVAGIRVGAAFGGAIDFLTGTTVRAPVAVQQAGAEWLWRLGHEPRRLFRRYVIEGGPAYARVRCRSA